MSIVSKEIVVDIFQLIITKSNYNTSLAGLHQSLPLTIASAANATSHNPKTTSDEKATRNNHIVILFIRRNLQRQWI